MIGRVANRQCRASVSRLIGELHEFAACGLAVIDRAGDQRAVDIEDQAGVGVDAPDMVIQDRVDRCRVARRDSLLQPEIAGEHVDAGTQLLVAGGEKLVDDGAADRQGAACTAFDVRFYGAHDGVQRDQLRTDQRSDREDRELGEKT